MCNLCAGNEPPNLVSKSISITKRNCEQQSCEYDLYSCYCTDGISDVKVYIMQNLSRSRQHVNFKNILKFAFTANSINSNGFLLKCDHIQGKLGIKACP